METVNEKKTLSVQMDSLQALSLATLIDCLRRFWTYGLAVSSAVPCASPAKEDTPPASPRCLPLCPLWAG